MFNSKAFNYLSHQFTSCFFPVFRWTQRRNSFKTFVEIYEIIIATFQSYFHHGKLILP